MSSNFDSFKFTKFLQLNSQQSMDMKRGHSHMIIPDDLLSNVSRSRSVLHSQINEEMVSNLIKPPHRISKETSKDRKIKTLEAKVQNQTTYMNMVVHDLRNPAESIQLGLKQAHEQISSHFTNSFKATEQFFKK
jgi:hypothetical protein